MELFGRYAILSIRGNVQTPWKPKRERDTPRHYSLFKKYLVDPIHLRIVAVERQRLFHSATQDWGEESEREGARKSSG